MEQTQRRRLQQVFGVLKRAGGWIWIREIARQVDLHPEQVRRLLDRALKDAVVEMDTPFRLRPVRLKSNVTLQGHLRYLRLMKRIDRSCL